MDKQQLLDYLEKLDAALDARAMLYIYGSAVCMVLENLQNYKSDIELWSAGQR